MALISYHDARQWIESKAAALNGSISQQRMDPEECLGRVLGADAIGEEDVPSFNNSAMDGFAVRSKDCLSAGADHPVVLKIQELILAGQNFQELVRPGACVRLMTGARVPTECDTIIKQEDVDQKGDCIHVFRPIGSGEHIRKKGEDFLAGSIVAKRGTQLNSFHRMAFKALGVNEIHVYEPIRVAVLATGSELVDESRQLGNSEIRNSTTPFILDYLHRPFTEVRYFGIVKDQSRDFEMRIQEMRSFSPHIILSTGAVSVGVADFVADSLSKSRWNVLFHRVAIRPGKPVLFAESPAGFFSQPCVLFGLPGNPISTAIGMRFFVEPYLRSLLGSEQEELEQARLSAKVKKPEGLRCFFKARVHCRAFERSIEVLPGQGSFLIHSALSANAWAILEESESSLKEDTIVSYLPLLPSS